MTAIDLSHRFQKKILSFGSQIHADRGKLLRYSQVIFLLTSLGPFFVFLRQNAEEPTTPVNQRKTLLLSVVLMMKYLAFALIEFSFLFFYSKCGGDR